MNKVTLFFIMACIFYLKGYAQQTEVLTLGVFHFDFPNLRYAANIRRGSD